MIKELLKQAHAQLSLLLFDPLEIGRRWRAMPYFVRNVLAYGRTTGQSPFRVTLRDLQYRTFDRFAPAGSTNNHYFHQDLWAARHLFDRGAKHHVDVGSRLDGFVAHVLPFCRVSFVDLRPLPAPVPGLDVQPGSILDLPFDSGSVQSLSSLHVLEHIGLGRYGDPVDPDGYLKAARELARVLAPGGTLLFSVPVGQERLVFDAHRVFDPRTIVEAFAGLRLSEFHLIDDRAQGIQERATFDEARDCRFGCGLFVFEKPAGVAR